MAILVSSNIFLYISTQLARRFKLSPLIISVVIIGLATTLPEMAVTLFAIKEGDPGLALGDALGSYVVNVMFVLALAITIGKVKIGTFKTQRTALILLTATTIFVALQFSSILPIISGWLLIFLLLVTFAVQLIMGINGRRHEDQKYIKHIKSLGKKSKLSPFWLVLLLAAISIAGLAIGGNITVLAVGKLSSVLGLSTTFLGMTLVAVSTSLPELVTILLAQHKKENKVVIGTILGSNTINITLFPALIAIFAGSINTSNRNLIFIEITALAITGIIFWFKGRIIPRWAGYPLLVGLIIFMWLSYRVQ